MATKIARNFTLAEIEQAINDSTGFCIACSEPTIGMVEPDADGYPCPSCGAPEGILGAEMILIMGLVA